MKWISVVFDMAVLFVCIATCIVVLYVIVTI